MFIIWIVFCLWGGLAATWIIGARTGHFVDRLLRVVDAVLGTTVVPQPQPVYVPVDIVEPVFGQLEHVRGIRQLRLRGLERARADTLVQGSYPSRFPPDWTSDFRHLAD